MLAVLAAGIGALLAVITGTQIGLGVLFGLVGVVLASLLVYAVVFLWNFAVVVPAEREQQHDETLATTQRDTEEQAEQHRRAIEALQRQAVLRQKQVEARFRVREAIGNLEAAFAESGKHAVRRLGEEEKDALVTQTLDDIMGVLKEAGLGGEAETYRYSLNLEGWGGGVEGRAERLIVVTKASLQSGAFGDHP